MLVLERLFKLGEYQQLDHRLEAFFRWVEHFSLGRALCMTTITMSMAFLLLYALRGVLFSVPALLVRLLIGLLCIDAGRARLYYHAHLAAASRNDSHARVMMAGELAMIHGVPIDRDGHEYLREL